MIKLISYITNALFSILNGFLFTRCKFCKKHITEIFSAPPLDAIYSCSNCKVYFYYGDYLNKSVSPHTMTIRKQNSVVSLDMINKKSHFDLIPKKLSVGSHGLRNDSEIIIDKIIEITPNNYYDVVHKEFLNGLTIHEYEYKLNKLDILK